MAELPRGRKSKKYDFLGGGLVTRPDDRYINLLNDSSKSGTGHFFSPQETNVQFTKIASMQKRLGYEQVGSDVQNAVWATQTADTANLASGTLTDSQTVALCNKVLAGSSASIIAVRLNIATTGVNVSNNAQVGTLIRNIKCVIKADSAGSPGTTLGTSNTLVDGLEVPHSTSSPTVFYFNTPVALTNATNYWFCFQGEVQVGASATSLQLAVAGATSGTDISKITLDSYSTFSTSTTNAGMTVYSTVAPVLGIYDYRPQTGGAITQFPIVACNGTLYYYNAGYTSIKTGLGATANLLYDFSTLKNYLFSCDYATSANQCWDGAASATMAHGYRGTMSALAQSASAGGPWSAAGIVKVILVTDLRSGGKRVSAIYSITLASTTNKIDLTNIAVDAVAAQFSFDIAATATTIYCTLPNGAIYYKVPAASLSTAGNPIANNQTTNSILPMTDATLIAGGSFESNTGYPQGYATGQVDTPKAKYLEVFQNMLASAGDPNNPSRVWFSEQYAPQVWGNGDSGTGIQGDFLDIAVDDGETVTGLAVADGALMVGKQTNIYRVDFTGNAADSWIVRKVHGQIGVLSNWSMQIIPDGLFFLSNRGPAICYGTYADVLPQTRLIQNLFDNTSADSFNLASMIYTVSCNDTTRNQVLMTISSPGVTIRDRILSYDYEQKMFALYDGYQANYVANIGDSNGFPVFWTGTLSGQVFKRSSAYLDNGAPIICSFTTPSIDLGDPSSFSQAEWLHIGYNPMLSGANLFIDLFANGSANYYRTVRVALQNNPSNQVAFRLGAVGQGLSLRFRNIDFAGEGAFELHWMRLEYSDSGGSRLG